MLELLELMDQIKLDEVRQAAKTPARYVKLWENLSIDTLGPKQYRRRLAPLYRGILDILRGADKRLLVHYDGQLRVISEDLAELDIDGIDSFTEPPEGDMTVADARAAWPDKFLWIHPNLHLYSLPEDELRQAVSRICREAGGRRYCLMISEEVPPEWQRSVPVVLRTLEEHRGPTRFGNHG